MTRELAMVRCKGCGDEFHSVELKNGRCIDCEKMERVQNSTRKHGEKQKCDGKD